MRKKEGRDFEEAIVGTGTKWIGGNSTSSTDNRTGKYRGQFMASNNNRNIYGDVTLYVLPVYCLTETLQQHCDVGNAIIILQMIKTRAWRISETCLKPFSQSVGEQPD